MNQDKPSLPSIKDLLEGGPGLIDYSQHINPKKSRHRRHASEHITGSHHSFPPTIPPPPLPSISYDHLEKPQEEELIHATLPLEMQSLSLDKPQKKPEPLAVKNLLLESKVEPNRRRTHSRSYSDFTHPYSLKQNDTNNRTPSPQTGKLPIAPTPLSLMPIRPKFPELEEEKTAEDPIVHTPLSKTILNHESTNPTKYVCPYCSKGFTRPSSLRTHTYSHTGEKPFLCTEPGCGRKFSVQSNLRRHLRVHRSKKPSTLFLSKNIH